MTVTYCKGLSSPIEELNELGYTKFEMFLNSYSKVFYEAACETVNHILNNTEFNKGAWNTYLQNAYQINKRHANSIISFSKGHVDSGKECRSLHIKTLEGQLKSLEEWITKANRKINLAKRFYRRNWTNSKSNCNFPIASDLNTKKTNWHWLKFKLHQKKRRAHLIRQKIAHLKTKPIQVKVPKRQILAVGSKDETLGNQICQWDNNTIRFRVPSCLESKFGTHITSNFGSFHKRDNRIPNDRAKTWHFYFKESRWIVGLQFTPSNIERQSRNRGYGSIGIDLNPNSIGWAYVDCHGNLKHHGQIPMVMGLPKGKQQAHLVDACMQLYTLANTFACPIVCENLDFSNKKTQLREKGKRYARMLSGWAYKKFYDLLNSILSNRGIELIKVNPAYTSVIGLVKYLKQYGLGSDEAAAIAIARRGMRLSERIPNAFQAYLRVNPSKHSWHWWRQLNTLLKESGISSRHEYYAIPNWELLVKQMSEVNFCSSKRKC